MQELRDASIRHRELAFHLEGGAYTLTFKYKPRGFKFKTKNQVAAWPRSDLAVAVEETDRMCYFTLTTGSADVYAMEVARSWESSTSSTCSPASSAGTDPTSTR